MDKLQSNEHKEPNIDEQPMPDQQDTTENINMNRTDYVVPNTDGYQQPTDVVDVTGASEADRITQPVEQFSQTEQSIPQVDSATAADLGAIASQLQESSEAYNPSLQPDTSSHEGGSDPMDQVNAAEPSQPEPTQYVEHESEPAYDTATNYQSNGESSDEYSANPVEGDNSEQTMSGENTPDENTPNFDTGEPVAVEPATWPPESGQRRPDTTGYDEAPVVVEQTTEPQVRPQGESANLTSNESLVSVAAAESAPAGPMISDVIAPSAAVAAAIAGTAGENAITGTPETTPVEVASALNQASNQASKPGTPKSKKWVIVLVVALVVLIFAGALVAAFLLKPASKSTSSVSTASKTLSPVVPVKTAAPGETIAAKTLDDYKAACAAGTITNAKVYTGTAPHPVVLFEKGSDGKYALSQVAFTDKTWAAEASKIEAGQLVSCIAIKTSSDKKLKTCPITDATTKVTTNVDFYSTDYDISTYEAASGKLLEVKSVPSVGTECPTTAVVSKVDPRIYARYDLAGIETALKDLVTKTIAAK